MTNLTLPFDVEQIRFINNYSEEEFEKYYPTYLKLVNKYSTELVDEFINSSTNSVLYLLTSFRYVG